MNWVMPLFITYELVTGFMRGLFGEALYKPLTAVFFTIFAFMIIKAIKGRARQ